MSEAVGTRRRWVVDALLGAGWAPASLFVIHAVMSFSGIYGEAPWLDIPMHWLGGVAIAYFFDRALASALSAGVAGRPSPSLVAVTVFCATCAAAVVWEIAEWTLDLYESSGNMLRIHDTMLDMIRGVAGGLVYLIVSRLVQRDRAVTRSSWAPESPQTTQGPAER